MFALETIVNAVFLAAGLLLIYAGWWGGRRFERFVAKN